MNPGSLYGIMSTQSRVVYGAACIVLLVLACFFAGCYSTPAPAPSATTPGAPAAGTNAISIKNFAFSPATLTVKTGTTVTWTNDDSAPHTVVSDDGAPVAFTSPSLATGASYPFTFTQAGTYAYHCSIHPSMKGTVVVQP
jgi:amicyanin